VHRARSRDRALAPQEIHVFLKAVMASNVRRQFKVALRSRIWRIVILGVGMPAGNPPACTSLRSLPVRRDRPRSV
jgi:hypothetical protein